jgi:hypothetical protein
LDQADLATPNNFKLAICGHLMTQVYCFFTYAI